MNQSDQLNAPQRPFLQQPARAMNPNTASERTVYRTLPCSPSVASLRTIARSRRGPRAQRRQSGRQDRRGQGGLSDPRQSPLDAKARNGGIVEIIEEKERAR